MQSENRHDPDNLPKALRFLSGGGRATALILARDWSTHRLGPPEGWPDILKSNLSLILNSPESMILVWGADELTFFFNETYFPLLGPRLSWAMGAPFIEVWADAWEQAKPIIDDAFAGRSQRFTDLPWKLDTDRGRADTWFTFSYSRILDAEGAIAGLFILTNETTDRVLGDAALRQSEERLRLVIEGARDHVIFTTDAAGIITTWSAGAEAVLGWPAEEAIGQSASLIFTPEDRADDADRREILKAARDGCANDERWHVRRDGSRVFLNGSMHPLPRDAEGLERGFIKVARDETSRYEADRRLARETERQRLSLQQMPGFAALLSGPDHVFDYVNDAYVAICGVRDFVGHAVRDVLPDIQGQGFYELLDQVFTTGEPFSGRALPIHLSYEAQPRYIDLLYQPVRDDGGTVVGIFVGGYDITDRVRAEQRREALLQLDSRLRGAADTAELSFRASELLGETMGAARVGYGAVDAAAASIRIERDWSAPGIASVAGTHAFDLFGTYFDALRAGEVVAIADVETDPRTRGGAAQRAIGTRALLDVPIVENGRTVGQIFVHADRPRQWTDGEIGLVREFAERTRSAIARRDAEERLRASEAKLANALASASLGPFEWDPATGHLDMDAQGRRIFGLPRAAAISDRDIFGRIAPDQAAGIEAAAIRLAGRGGRVDFACDIDLPDGTRRYVRSSGATIDTPQGRRVIGVFQDATELKAAERAMLTLNETLEARVSERTSALETAHEQLRQSQKMEAVGQLTGGLAHDFNNLLTGMMGNLELLQMRLGQGRLDQLDRFIAAAQGAGRRAASLTQRLLAFSRRQTLDPKPTDVNRLIAGMEDLLARTVGPLTPIEIVAEPGLWSANIDAGQLENALLNLCINARDAMPDGGRITITTANVGLDERGAQAHDLPPGEYLSIAVGDTGTGMSRETIARAFEPFFTTKPLGEGTGLGLSMIYGFARQSNGQVRIHSTLGEGSTVSIHLPRHVGAAAIMAEEESGAAAATASGQTILVVDDEATVRHLIDEVLDELGYTVIGAADGAAGIKVLQSGARIELLITDVGLPNGMNGRQVADAARALRPGLKVLFITGYAENAAVGNGHLEPGMELLTKPFTLEALAAKVATMMAD
jgi:PAS domain S-box-containing protein